MAQDQWHHIEGALPSAGVFRAYFYDNYTQPISAKAFSGSVVVQAIDLATKMPKDVATFPLRLSRDGKTLEAALKNVPRRRKTRRRRWSRRSRWRRTARSSRSRSPSSSIRRSRCRRPHPPQRRRPRPALRPASPRHLPRLGGQAGDTTPLRQRRLSSSCSRPPVENCEPNMARTDALLLSDSLPKNSKALLTLLSMCSDEVQKLVQGPSSGSCISRPCSARTSRWRWRTTSTKCRTRGVAQASDAIRTHGARRVAARHVRRHGQPGKDHRSFYHFAAAIAAVKTAYAPQP